MLVDGNNTWMSAGGTEAAASVILALPLVGVDIAQQHDEAERHEAKNGAGKRMAPAPQANETAAGIGVSGAFSPELF